MTSDVSVVIPNYNGSPIIHKCLSRLTAYSDITVVDDASTDNSVRLLEQEYSHVKVLRRSVNGGFAATVNDGIRGTTGEYILLLNTDVEVTLYFLDSILPLFEDKTLFAVSPRIIVEALGGIDDGVKTGIWHHGFFWPGNKQNVTDVQPVLHTSGCASVYRRSMLVELGGFCEAYSPFYWEDGDLGYRAWKRGWKSLYQPASTVYHQHSATISKLNVSFKERMEARNQMFFIWRNIEDKTLMWRHRCWLPLILARRFVSGDWSFLGGWKDAYTRRAEAVTARQCDSAYRTLSDSEIFKILGILT